MASRQGKASLAHYPSPISLWLVLRIRCSGTVDVPADSCDGDIVCLCGEDAGGHLHYKKAPK